VSSATVPPHPSLPRPDSLSQFFWDGCREHKLLIQRCGDCGHYIHPPRLVCRFCQGTNLAPSEVSGRGVVDTFTIPLQPFDPYFMSKVPYTLAVIELPEEPHLKLVSNVVDIDPDDVRIGMPVEVVFTDLTPEVTLPLFRPAPS
jgi:uncharacterized OB-fold protein